MENEVQSGLVGPGYKFTFEAQRAACVLYSQTGSRSAAAEAAGVSLSTVDRRYRNDPTFRAAMVEAKAAFVRYLERAAIDRAVEGVTQSKPGPGGVFYDQTVYSDALLIHMLKKMDPERHGDKQIVQIDDSTTSLGVENLTPEARQQIKQILLDQMKRVEVLADDRVESEDDDQPTSEPEANVS